MSLNIKNPEAHALASRLAQKTGETLTMRVVANAAPEFCRAAKRSDRDRRGRGQAPATFPECEGWDFFGRPRDSVNLEDEIKHH